MWNEAGSVDTFCFTVVRYLYALVAQGQCNTPSMPQGIHILEARHLYLIYSEPRLLCKEAFIAPLCHLATLNPYKLARPRQQAL